MKCIFLPVDEPVTVGDTGDDGNRGDAAPNQFRCTNKHDRDDFP